MTLYEIGVARGSSRADLNQNILSDNHPIFHTLFGTLAFHKTQQDALFEPPLIKVGETAGRASGETGFGRSYEDWNHDDRSRPQAGEG